MKPIRFTPAAEEEMTAAAVYYEGQRHRLGRRFLATVRESLEKILRNHRRHAPSP